MNATAQNLLLIACSQRKVAGRHPGRAWDVYDGRLFQVLKKVFRAHPDAEGKFTILIISAKYGVIHAEQIIRCYDARITSSLIKNRKDFWTAALHAAVFGRSFTTVHVNLGRTYLQVLPNLTEWFAPLKISWATGGIGVRNAQTRRWVLEQISSASTGFANML